MPNAFGVYGCWDVNITDCKAAGNWDAGIFIKNSHGVYVSRLDIDIKNPRRYGVKIIIGPEQPCTCGSGKKFKDCHGAKKMKKGIISDNSEARFEDTNIKIDGEGVGVHVTNGDKSKFFRTNIVFGSDIDIEKLIHELSIPVDVPREYVEEAVAIASDKKDPEALRYSRLKMWLIDNNLGVKFAADTIVALTAAVIQAYASMNGA
jgi:parallel beta-helix repeat protein